MMQELFAQPYFGVLLTIAAYWAGMKIQHKTRLAICNGMLLAVLLVIAVLLVFHIPYESYYQGGALINLFLGPATACMAVTIYSQRRLLAKHWLPVLVGCTVGVVTIFFVPSFKVTVAVTFPVPFFFPLIFPFLFTETTDFLEDL